MRFSIVAEGLGFTEGPTALPDGRVAVTSITGGAVFLLGDRGEPERIDTGGGPNGATVDSAGTLYVAQNGGIWGGKEGTEAGVQRVTNGTVDRLVGGVGAPNDICFGPDGRLWFTDSRGETDPDDPEAGPPGRLYSCEADGSDLSLALEGPAFINGLAFDEEGAHLYVVETGRKRVLRYRWDAGTLSDPEPVYELDSGYPDGIALDRDGNIWLAATFQPFLHVFTPEGDSVERIDLGEGASNCCFGGPDLDRLYVTVPPKGAVYRLDPGTRGLPLHPFR